MRIEQHPEPHPAVTMAKAMGFVLCHHCNALNLPWRRTEQGLRCYRCSEFVDEKFEFGDHMWELGIRGSFLRSPKGTDFSVVDAGPVIDPAFWGFPDQ